MSFTEGKGGGSGHPFSKDSQGKNYEKRETVVKSEVLGVRWTKRSQGGPSERPEVVLGLSWGRPCCSAWGHLGAFLGSSFENVSFT